MGLFRFHSLFGRTLATIALVSVGFQLLTLSVLAFYVLVPLGKRATDDLAAVMVHAMQRWERLPEQERPAFRKILKQNHDLTLVVTDTPLPDNTDFLPYFYFLRQALARRVGDEVRLKTSRDAKGNEWIWAEIPDYSQKLRLGFLRSRIGIQPPLALLLLFCAGTVLTFFTAALLARRLTIPPRTRLPLGTDDRKRQLAGTGKGRRAGGVAGSDADIQSNEPAGERVAGQQDTAAGRNLPRSPHSAHSGATGLGDAA
ncbi:hypothetical protein L0Y14_02065 [Candidatus Endoriftia persephone]|jgi:two-component system osmolarity sensor histidine kinase EnvZ|uniref:Uncharacterized protein n=1 Tax=Candidatus Endoriftia persephonae TaxID=393765 RepID=A0A9J6ZYW5_9GAMM|nr:hypothetical protein [Candidatus Endoriftia persephone]USF88054.1 hypothetical protein L0Y14_02065 [Candidatus Endoriftia persephone]